MDHLAATVPVLKELGISLIITGKREPVVINSQRQCCRCNTLNSTVFIIIKEQINILYKYTYKRADGTKNHEGLSVTRPSVMKYATKLEEEERELYITLCVS